MAVTGFLPVFQLRSIIMLAIDPVVSDTKLPEKTDVVVIGGGIAGVSTAYFLAERGVDVVLCEKGVIAGEQSSRNWGWVRQQARDPRELPLIVETLKLWRGLDERIQGDTGFRQCGVLYLDRSEADLAKREEWLEMAQPYQIGSRILARNELEDLVPGLETPYAGGLYTASDGRAEPQKAAPALANAARRLGARVFTGCAVRGIERQNGRVASVVTEHGAIRCSSVILAGGAWSRHFCKTMGITLPQLTVRSSVLRTGPVDGAPQVNMAGDGFGIRARNDGGYNVANPDISIAEIVPDSFRFFLDFLPLLKMARKSVRLRIGKRFIEEWRRGGGWSLDQKTPFEFCRILDPEPVPWVLNKAIGNLQRALPAFHGVQVEESWAGYIDATPDAVPVMSEVEDCPGFFIATGFSGHGFGIGPGAGVLMADLVTGKTPVVDPEPFRLSRFSEGGRARPIVGF